MSNLKILRGRVKTIKSTQKITKAMQMVSASKLNKIKSRVHEIEEYVNALENMMSALGASGIVNDLDKTQQRFFSYAACDGNTRNEAAHSVNVVGEKLIQERADGDMDLAKASLFVVITSERGLCGSFNSNITRYVKNEIDAAVKQGKKVKLLVVGKKGFDALSSAYSSHIDSYFNIEKGDNIAVAVQLKNKIMQLIEQGEIQDCCIFFNKFKNAITQIPTCQHILPIGISAGKSDGKQDNKQVANYEFEGEGLVNNVVSLYLNGQINFALLHSKASEEGARMTAMDNATKNAADMINHLTLKLNRSRQAIITKELIEIIAGAEAV